MKEQRLLPKCITLFLIFSILLVLTSCAEQEFSMPVSGQIQEVDVAYQQLGSEQNTEIAVKALSTNEFIEIHFIDVGQGDSTLVLLPTGQTLLIDAGDVQYGDQVVSYLQGLAIKRIDFVVATHPHTDHIGGLAKVIKGFDIGSVYMPDIIHTTKTFENLLLAIENKNLKINMASADVVMLEAGNLKAQFVAPVIKTDDLNNMSAVLTIVYGKKSFLFMGDAEKESEGLMLNSGANLAADVIKIGHHGSRTSSTNSFIQAVKPDHAIISCGRDNSYGHPSADILHTLSQNGIKVYRTDEVGTVIVRSDGEDLTLLNNERTIQPNAPPQTAQSEAPVGITKVQEPTKTSEVKKENLVASETKSIEVFVTNTGKRYHIGTCSSLRKSKIPTTITKAKENGYTSCGNCHPPQ